MHGLFLDRVRVGFTAISNITSNTRDLLCMVDETHMVHCWRLCLHVTSSGYSLVSLFAVLSVDDAWRTKEERRQHFNVEVHIHTMSTKLLANRVNEFQAYKRCINSKTNQHAHDADNALPGDVVREAGFTFNVPMFANDSQFYPIYANGKSRSTQQTLVEGKRLNR